MHNTESIIVFAGLGTEHALHIFLLGNNIVLRHAAICTICSCIVPLPVKEIHVEFNGSVDEASLQVNGFSLLGLVAKQCQLSIPPLRRRQLPYVGNKLNFVHLCINDIMCC